MNIRLIYKDEIRNFVEKEKELINRLLEEYGSRAEKKLNEQVFFEVHIKSYGKTKVNEFEVLIKMFCSEKIKCSKHFFEANSTERDLGKAIHNALDKIGNEVEHKMHLSDQGKR